MQYVSPDWKKSQKETLVPTSYVHIQLKVGDPNAQADAKPTDNGHEFYSHTELLTDELEKQPVKWATLENGLWLLDGTYRILGMDDTPPEPQETTYYGFIPAGEVDTMLTVDWQEFFVVNQRGQFLI